jgi:hypothetical protein
MPPPLPQNWNRQLAELVAGRYLVQPPADWQAKADELEAEINRNLDLDGADIFDVGPDKFYGAREAATSPKQSQQRQPGRT